MAVQFSHHKTPPATHGGQSGLSPIEVGLKALHALTDRGWNAAQTMYRRYRNRQGVRQMLELDDSLLRDMGVTRYDVMRASRTPLTHSAGAELGRMSRCRAMRKRSSQA